MASNKPLSKQSVSTPSGRISYTDRGTGPAALFVHGVLLNGYLWRHPSIRSISSEMTAEAESVRYFALSIQNAFEASRLPIATRTTTGHRWPSSRL